MIRDIPCIDVFRGSAAFLVVTAHCMVWSNCSGIPGIQLPSAALSVDLFMILSGYLMAFNSIQRAHVEPMEEPRSRLIFYIRRYFRLAPAYYVALIIASVIIPGPWIHGMQVLSDQIPGMNDTVYNPKYINYSPTNIILNLTFISGLLPSYTVSTLLPVWSLSLEMQFYLFFPFLYIAFRRYGYIKITLLLTAICALVTEIFSHISGDHGSAELFPVPSFIILKLPVFLIGILICDAVIRKELGRNQRISMCILALALVGVDAWLYPYFRHEIKWLFIASIFIMFLTSDTTAFNKPRDYINGLINNKFWHFMSDTSYGVYMFQGLFISLIGGYLFSQQWFLDMRASYRTMIFWLMVVTSSYILAFFVRLYIEKPGIKMGKYLIKKVKTHQAYPSASPQTIH